MTRILIFIVLMSLALPGFAQNQNQDISCSINFTPLSNSPPDSVMWGEADYYQVLRPPLPWMTLFYTNLLDVYLSLPTTPKDVWLLLQEKNGTFKPITEVTNVDDQFITLTTNQIHSLVEGSWYVDVDFGDSNYLGHLAPQYLFAIGPTVEMDFPPVLDEEGLEHTYIVISPNNHNATFAFNGSHCTDPFYLPMKYDWTCWTGYFAQGNPIFTARGELTAHVFNLGAYVITLQASDSITSSYPYYFYVNVITASQAINTLITEINGSVLTDNQKRGLVYVLSNAAVQFDDGHMAQGCAELGTYERLVEAMHLNSTVVPYLTQPAQDILNAF
jgi:hypothetical protein